MGKNNEGAGRMKKIYKGAGGVKMAKIRRELEKRKKEQGE